MKLSQLYLAENPLDYQELILNNFYNLFIILLQNILKEIEEILKVNNMGVYKKGLRVLDHSKRKEWHLVRYQSSLHRIFRKR